MKSILLKIDDDLFTDLEESIKEVKISKTAFIKNSIKNSIKAIKLEKLKRELKKEIEEIKKYELDKELIKEFEIASLVDLQKFYDDEEG
jgi:flagellar motor component MotA